MQRGARLEEVEHDVLATCSVVPGSRRSSTMCLRSSSSDCSLDMLRPRGRDFSSTVCVPVGANSIRRAESVVRSPGRSREHFSSPLPSLDLRKESPRPHRRCEHYGRACTCAVCETSRPAAVVTATPRVLPTVSRSCRAHLSVMAHRDLAIALVVASNASGILGLDLHRVARRGTTCPEGVAHAKVRVPE